MSDDNHFNSFLKKEFKPPLYDIKKRPFRDHDSEKKGAQTDFHKCCFYFFIIILLFLSSFLCFFIYLIGETMFYYVHGLDQEQKKQFLLSTLNYLKSIGLGFTIGSVVAGVVANRVYEIFKKNNP